jgi:hypothetical protein
MSLRFPRSFVLLVALAVGVALVSASCGGSEPRSSVAPSSLSASAQAGIGGGSARVTTAGETGEEGDEGEEPTPEPAPAPGPEPAPGPAPAPAPTPAPAPSPYNPNTDPGPFPAPPRTNVGDRGPIYWTPSHHPRVRLRINPDPVPFSGVAVPLASCSGLAHTWYYEQLIHAETGIPFRLTERENYFDGRLVSRSNENIYVGGNDTGRINSRWCSAFGNAHTAQHRFKGKDDEGNDIIVNGPLIQLQQNPHYVPPPPAPAPASQSQRLGNSAIVVFGG